uniref:Uncharacterized protein n=1 Tax=Aegilops tauschii subsp. strangulata TaxID=200361 RepID=A0A453ADW3_AEGTS
MSCSGMASSPLLAESSAFPLSSPLLVESSAFTFLFFLAVDVVDAFLGVAFLASCCSLVGLANQALQCVHVRCIQFLKPVNSLPSKDNVISISDLIVLLYYCPVLL